MSSGITYAGSHSLKGEGCTFSNETPEFERGRVDERAVIVAWLRKHATERLGLNRGTPSLSDIISHQELSWAADELEAGAHKEAEK